MTLMLTLTLTLKTMRAIRHQREANQSSKKKPCLMKMKTRALKRVKVMKAVVASSRIWAHSSLLTSIKG